MSDFKTKYRPRTIDKFIGNEDVIEAFVSDISKKNRKRAYFITGPRGCGKTSLARIGAVQYLKAEDFNINEINASDDRGIDTVRELKEMCSISTDSPRAWIIDEVHMTTVQFQNAILKLLEEGNPNDFFFLCTTEPDKLLGTVKSRCGKYNLEFPEDIEIKRHLREIGKAEGFTISPNVSKQIIKKSEGHIRDAVDLLQSVCEMKEEKALKYLESIIPGESQTAEAKEFVTALYDHKPQLVKKLLKILKDNKENPESIRIFIMNWGAGRLLRSWSVSDAIVMENFEKPYYEVIPWTRFTLDCFRACNDAAFEDDIPF